MTDQGSDECRSYVGMVINPQRIRSRVAGDAGPTSLPEQMAAS
ncbi:MAG TPA: hypothetical protein VHS54_08640 [Jatrophihabitans sp.]|jgi:hypothetical protein|nr:hypothetical protein [Jatrophihabitans sp.]